MSKKLTPWFEMQPVHVGVYSVKSPWRFVKNQYFSYWDGERFNWVSQDVARAFEMRKLGGSGRYIKQWRGLAKKP